MQFGSVQYWFLVISFIVPAVVVLNSHFPKILPLIVFSGIPTLLFPIQPAPILFLNLRFLCFISSTVPTLLAIHLDPHLIICSTYLIPSFFLTMHWGLIHSIFDSNHQIVRLSSCIPLKVVSNPRDSYLQQQFRMLCIFSSFHSTDSSNHLPFTTNLYQYHHSPTFSIFLPNPSNISPILFSNQDHILLIVFHIHLLYFQDLLVIQSICHCHLLNIVIPFNFHRYITLASITI